MSQAPEILIVDDEGALLKLMGAYVRRLGYAVTTANSMAKAWAHLNAAPGRFAVVVVDAGLAESTVDDLALRLLASHPALRLVVNSGYPVDMSGLLKAQPGRVEFLHKPFSPDMLVGALRRMLGAEEKV